MTTNSPIQQLTALIEMAETQKKASQFGTLQKVLNEIESELHRTEGDLDDQMYCEIAFYLARNFETLGYLGKAAEYYEQACLFAPEVSSVEEKALIREVRLKSFLRLKEDLEPSYDYLSSFDQESDFQYLTSLGFAELVLGKFGEAMNHFEKAFHLPTASKEEKKHLFFQLIEQEIFYGYNFSKIVQLFDLTMFDEITPYEQTLIFILTNDLAALQFLGQAWFSRMNPCESIKASFLLSQVKDFRHSWAFKPYFFHCLSQFDFQSQTVWRNFFEKVSTERKSTAS